MALSIPIISEFDGKGIDRAIKEFNQLEGAGAKTGFALKKAMVPAIAVLGGLATGLGLATAAAVEDQKAQDLLAQQLRTSAMATDDVIASNEEFISGMSQAFAVADDQLRPAMANLVRSTGSVEVAQGLMTTALDIAAATGMDLETVTLALGKAANGQTAALTKLDPSLKGVIDSSSTLDDITGALAVSFGGAATVAAESFDGRMKSMKIALDETKESIGAALLPVLQKLLELLQPVAKFAQENTKLFLIITGVIGGFAAAIIAANIAIKVFTIATQIASAAQAVFNFIMSANPIALVIIAVAAFVAALIILEKRFGIISTGFELFSAGFNKFIIDPIKTAIRFIGDLINAFKKIPGVGAIGNFASNLNIPGFADGGIVTQPTLAMVGERGPEAIVPLSRDGGVGGVTVNVTGGLSTSAEIGQAVVNAIRAYNRSAGAGTDTGRIMAGTAVVGAGNYSLEIDTGFLQDAFILDDTTKGVLNNTIYVLDGTTEFADVTTGIDSIMVKRGRRDQGDQFSAGTMSFNMLDTSGIFNPFDTQSPYYDPTEAQPGLAPMRKVRLARYDNLSAKEYLFKGYIVNYDYNFELGGIDTVSVYCADDFYLLSQTYMAEFNVSAQLTSARLSAVLDLPEVAFPIGQRDIATGTQTLGGSSVFTIADGTNTLQYCTEINLAEQGRLFMSRDGDLTFDARIGSTLSQPVADFHDDGTNIPYNTVGISFEADQVVNRASVSILAANPSPQVADNAASQAKYFVQTTSITGSLLSTDAAALVLADYLLEPEPEARYTAVGFNLNMLTTAQRDDVAIVDIGDTITIEKTFASGAGTTELAQELSVEGIEHTITVSNGHSIMYFTAPTTIVYELILNDAVFGIIDSTNVLG